MRIGFGTGFDVRRASGSAPVSYATWNPLDKAATLTLSNGDLTATRGEWWTAARATIGVDSGDWFFTVTVDTTDYVMIGVGTATANLTYMGQGDSESWGVSSHGYGYYPGSYESTGITFVEGEVVGCVIRRSAKLAYFYKYNGSEWQTIAMYSIASADGETLYPMISCYLNGVGTANFGASAFPLTPPFGANPGVYE